jgi:hypothetical protein
MRSISVEVDIIDIIWGMSRYDRKEFFNRMQDEGYISKSCVITDEGEVKASAHTERKALTESKDDFNNACNVLYNNGWRLTKEEEEYIINLSKRFINE